MSQYFYVKKVVTTNENELSYSSGVVTGDYVLFVGQTTGTENGIYQINTASGNSKISTQPTAEDFIISYSQNEEWKFVTGTTFTKSTVLGAGTAIRLAIQNYESSVTKPQPIGSSVFPEQIDTLKVIDFSTTSAKTSLQAYHEALAAFYAAPGDTTLNNLTLATAAVQNYVLTESDYNKLASSIMNTQLYIKQYLNGSFEAISNAIDSYIIDRDDYISNYNATLIKTTSTDPNQNRTATQRHYIWYEEV
jgi:hypothetical protein